MSSKSASWRERIPAADWHALEAAGYGRQRSLGDALALLVVDVTYDFTGPREAKGRDEAVQYWPQACGPCAWEAVGLMAGLIRDFRRYNLPVVYTRHEYLPVGHGIASWAGKARIPDEMHADQGRIVDEIAPAPADVVLTKHQASGFFGTSLATVLVSLGVRDLVVCGGTTSGCVRASVVDAFSYGFPVWVVEDLVFDRSTLSHAVSLFDMQQKYADVLSVEALRAHLTENRNR